MSHKESPGKWIQFYLLFYIHVSCCQVKHDQKLHSLCSRPNRITLRNTHKNVRNTHSHCWENILRPNTIVRCLYSSYHNNNDDYDDNMMKIVAWRWCHTLLAVPCWVKERTITPLLELSSAMQIPRSTWSYSNMRQSKWTAEPLSSNRLYADYYNTYPREQYRPQFIKNSQSTGSQCCELDLVLRDKRRGPSKLPRVTQVNEVRQG